jgi:hypothetical protein
MTPFDFVNSINLTKKNLFEDPLAHKDYSPFLINKSLSFFPDTVLYANEMNQFAEIPKDWQFFFFLNTIPKKKRYSKWFKKDPKSDSLSMVIEYFGYSAEKARDALSVLTEDQLAMIKEKLYKGGK